MTNARVEALAREIVDQMQRAGMLLRDDLSTGSAVIVVREVLTAQSPKTVIPALIVKRNEVMPPEPQGELPDPTEVSAETGLPICWVKLCHLTDAAGIDALEDGTAEVFDEVEALLREHAKLKAWVDDLQSGMFINCVYCGHRYGPEDEVPATMADALKEHIEQCQKHPMSALKREHTKLLKLIDDLTNPQRIPRCPQCMAKMKESK